MNIFILINYRTYIDFDSWTCNFFFRFLQRINIDFCILERILNRFSKDMNITDEWLPKLILEAILGFYVVCSIMITEAIIKQWMLVLIVILFFFAMKSYMKIGQDFKRLEGISKYIRANNMLLRKAAYIIFLRSKFVSSCQKIRIFKFLHFPEFNKFFRSFFEYVFAFSVKSPIFSYIKALNICRRSEAAALKLTN